jgi:hypothetical protein
VKALASGAVVALASGVLMGAALKPDIADLDRPAGPQTVVGWTSARADAPLEDGTALASYDGKIPDYVLGTDFKRTTELFPTAEAPPPLPPIPDETEPAEVPLTPASYADEALPPPQPSFPSIDGGAPAIVAAQAEPTAG